MFLDQLARLGVINKVSTLAGPASDDENEDETKPEKVESGGASRFVHVCVCSHPADLNAAFTLGRSKENVFYSFRTRILKLSSSSFWLLLYSISFYVKYK